MIPLLGCLRFARLRSPQGNGSRVLQTGAEMREQKIKTERDTWFKKTRWSGKKYEKREIRESDSGRKKGEKKEVRQNI